MLEKLSESRSWQLLLITVLILIVPLMVDIHGRMDVIRRMRQEEARLQQELAAVQAEHQALQEELAYVNGDAYLEQWARTEARMTKPGEVTVIPLAADSSTQTAATRSGNPSDAPPPTSIPEQWHSLFFDVPAAP